MQLQPDNEAKEQSRLAVNSVTLGDYTRPVQIGSFIKDLFAGFQLLNLKNDVLRKRSDSMKYSVRFLAVRIYLTAGADVCRLRKWRTWCMTCRCGT